MKIVLCNYRYFVSSGAEVFLFKCQRLLEARGHTVIPFSTVNGKNEPTPYAKWFCKARSGEGDVYFKNIRKTPKNILRMLAGAFYNRDAKKALLALLRAEKPDCMLVLQQMNALSPSVFAAAKQAGVPVVHRLSDFNLVCPRYDCMRDGGPCTDCLRGNYLPAIKHRCVKGSLPATLIRSAAMTYHNLAHVYGGIFRFVVPAAFTKQLLVKSGIAAERIRHIPTFIESADVTPAYTNDGYALFLGRLSPEKGVNDLVSALAKTKNKQITLKLTGDVQEEYAASLAARAEELGVRERVEFTGFVRGDALRALIDGCACVCLPAVWYENLPNAVLEAYAHGKPVIVSRIGSLTEMVVEGETGLLCEPGNPDSLASCLDTLFSDNSLPARMGVAARALCEERYAPDAFYDKLMDVFAQAVASREG